MYRWMLSILLFLLFSVAGCTALQGKSGVETLSERLSWLQDTPNVEIASSQLTCEPHPEIVDGNLETVGTFDVQGFLRKQYRFEDDNPRSAHMGGYRTEFEGTTRCELVIKLEKPMYVSTVEVYPASRIPNLALSTTLEEAASHIGQSGRGFKPVHDKQHKNVEGTKPVKFQVGRKVLYLRVTAGALEDQQNAERFEHQEIDIPLKGASIREVKLYGKQSS